MWFSCKQNDIAIDMFQRKKKGNNQYVENTSIFNKDDFVI